MKPIQLLTPSPTDHLRQLSQQASLFAPAAGSMATPTLAPQQDQVTLSSKAGQIVGREISHVGQLRFAKDPGAGNTAIYATSEIAIAGYPSSGGLGIVSAQTGSALNTYYGKDVRVLIPASAAFEKKILDPAEGWQDSHEEIRLPVPWKDYQKDYHGDPEAVFHVWQKRFDGYNLPVYALTSHSKILNPFEYSPNTPANYVGISDIPNDKIAKNWMGVYTKDLADGTEQVMLLCDKAMAVLANRLDPTKYKPEPSSQLKQFDRHLDHWIVNDWITGPMDCMAEVPKDVGITFITHNTYDKTVPTVAAKAFGLPTTSLLRSAMERADVVIVNDDFFKTCTQTQFLDKQKREAVKQTFQKLDPDTVFNMHHGYGDEFNPNSNPVLAGKVALAPTQYDNKFWISKYAKKNAIQPAPLPKGSWQFSELKPYEPKPGDEQAPRIRQAYQSPLKPTVLPLVPTFQDKVADKLRQVLSWLTLGLWKPDSLAQRFERLNAERQTVAGEQFAKARAKAQDNYAGAVDRTISLPEAQHLLQWKLDNKLALQHWLKLKPDSQAVLFISTSRLDVAQKMGNVVMNELVPFLESHPHAQFVGTLDYDGGNSANNQMLRHAADKFPDRFKLLPFNINAQKLINAAGHYSVMPSAYEPYGTGQLQASAMGCVPIANDIDGLHQSVSDPAMNGPYLNKEGEDSGQKVWQYGQTGLFINRVMAQDWMDVCKQLDFKLPGRVGDKPLGYEVVRDHLPAAERQTWVAAHEGFRQTLERAYDTTLNHPDQFALMAQNGMDFVLNNHNWQSIAGRYEAPLAKAWDIAQQRNKTETASTTRIETLPAG